MILFQISFSAITADTHPWVSGVSKDQKFYEKLKSKGVILRSTEYGYKIKNMLRLTIGSKKENLKFMKVTESIFRK